MNAERPKLWREVAHLYWRTAWVNVGPVGKSFFIVAWGFLIYMTVCVILPGVQADSRITTPAVAVLYLRAVYIAGTHGLGLYRDWRDQRAPSPQKQRGWTEDDL